jgi:hypothetical protein
MHTNGEVRMGTNSAYLAPKGLETIAQGFNPGLTAMKGRALKVAPNPADAGCNSKLAQYSNTPLLHHPACRIRGRGRRRGRERSAPRVAPEFGLCLPQTIECWAGYRPWIWCPFRAHRLKTPNPGLKPWAEIYCPFGAKTSSPERFINGGPFVTCAIETNTDEC